jgi:hypothetical protein
MTSSDVPPPAGILAPTYRALRWGAWITGQEDVLIDYYVEAIDGQGNVQRSPIQHVYVGSGGSVGNVGIEPDPAVAGQSVTVTYDPAGRVLQSAAQVYLHYGFNNWSPTVSPDPAMTWNASDSVWQLAVPVAANAEQLDLVFNDGAGNWDNNNGIDWHFDVAGGSGGTFTMDGQLDAGATLVASNGALQLYAAYAGTTLYVAAADAGEGNDHFIFVAGAPGSMWSAPWAKSGMVARWSAFLGHENGNLWSGWFDVAGVAASASGDGSGWLEGTLELTGEFGTIPDRVYLAFAPYGDADSAPLWADGQVPASINGDGDVDPAEYAVFVLAPPACPGDSNCDDVVNWRDIDYFVAAQNDNVAGWEAMFAPSAPACPFENNDTNDDGSVNWRDIDPFVALMNTGCP